MSQQIKLKTPDGYSAEIPIHIAHYMGMVKNILEDVPDCKELPLHNCTRPYLEKIILFCKHYHKNKDIDINMIRMSPFEALPLWYREFCIMHITEYNQLTYGANYLDIEILRLLLCNYLLHLSKDMDSIQLRTLLGFAPLSVEKQCEISEILNWYDPQ